MSSRTPLINRSIKNAYFQIFLMNTLLKIKFCRRKSLLFISVRVFVRYPTLPRSRTLPVPVLGYGCGYPTRGSQYSNTDFLPQTVTDTSSSPADNGVCQSKIITDADRYLLGAIRNCNKHQSQIVKTQQCLFLLETVTNTITFSHSQCKQTVRSFITF